MVEFDPERFEEKYAHYFPQLQRAYKNAFERMNQQYDSQLVHAIDQQVLDESEPFYEGDGEFRVELPADPFERTGAALDDEAQFDAVLSAYVERIETELRAVFGFDGG
ncbi:MAG: DUF5783 family protein [Halobacteriales archaeon]